MTAVSEKPTPVKPVYRDDWREDPLAPGRAKPGWRVECAECGLIGPGTAYGSRPTADQVATHHRTLRHPGPRRYSFTRDELIDALTHLEVTVPTSGPLAGKVLAESMADALIEALDGIAAERGQ